MKTILLILAAAILSAQSEIVVYKQAFKRSSSGDAKIASATLSGFTVFEFDQTGAIAVARITVNAKAKNYVREFVGFDDWNLDTVQTGISKNSMVYTENLVDFDQSNWRSVFNLTAKGANFPVLVGTRQLSIPKAWTFNGRAIQKTDAGVTVLDEISGTASLDVKETAAALALLVDSNGEIERLAQRYLALGYVEK